MPPALVQPSGGHILNQPFTIAELSIPINCMFTCNCAPEGAPMPVVGSAPVTCALCEKTYRVTINPANGQIAVMIMTPKMDKVPS